MKNEMHYVAPILEVESVRIEKGIAASFPETTADQMNYFFLDEE